MDNAPRHIVMVASENDALVGGKVGGVGDVIKGLSDALARKGRRVTTIIPAYGFLHKKNLSRLDSIVEFPFAGRKNEAEIWEVRGRQHVEGLTHFVVEHHDIRGDPIYVNDPPETPFKHDATKYALFCSAVGQFLASFHTPHILHLHDWHAATLLMLSELHADFSHLNHRRTVFTIHNLAIQGTRPIQGDESSLKSWFPELFENSEWIDGWRDRRYDVPCYTPMAFGIRLSDRVNTVSPSYAEEILRVSDHSKGFYGGEGLEEFVMSAKDERRLFGILNGTEYPKEGSSKPSFAEMCELICNRIADWNSAHVNGLADEIIRRCQKFKDSPPAIIFTSITRAVEQKVRLLLESGNDGKSALERIMERLEQRNGCYFFLGTGTSDYGDRLSEMCRSHERFIFLNGYSPPIAQALYKLGTLYVMPSLFEPCGISQMVAMSEGQPCIVHAVGGLKDTVIDGVNGFAFSGGSHKEKSENFKVKVDEAMNLYFGDPLRWKLLREKAASSRFTWEASAQQYIDLTYC